MADKKPTVPDWDHKKDGEYKELVSRTAKSTAGAKRRTVEGARKVAGRTYNLSDHRRKKYGEVFDKRIKARDLLVGNTGYMEDTIKSKTKREEKFKEDSDNAHRASKQWQAAFYRKKKLDEMAKKKEAK